MKAKSTIHPMAVPGTGIDGVRPPEPAPKALRSAHPPERLDLHASPTGPWTTHTLALTTGSTDPATSRSRWKTMDKNPVHQAGW